MNFVIERLNFKLLKFKVDLNYNFWQNVSILTFVEILPEVVVEVNLEFEQFEIEFFY
jgi:hypothetical protein